MTRNDIRDSILHFISEETDIKMDGLSDDLSFESELGLDSVDIVGVIMRIERHYRIRISHEELINARFAGQLIDLVYEKLTNPDLAASPQ